VFNPTWWHSWWYPRLHLAHGVTLLSSSDDDVLHITHRSKSVSGSRWLTSWNWDQTSVLSKNLTKQRPDCMSSYNRKLRLIRKKDRSIYHTGIKLTCTTVPKYNRPSLQRARTSSPSLKSTLSLVVLSGVVESSASHMFATQFCITGESYDSNNYKEKR